MTDKNIAYQHLLEAVLRRHSVYREADDPVDENDFFDFSDDELRRIIEALWLGRYSSERKEFKNIVGTLVSEKVTEQ